MGTLGGGWWGRGTEGWGQDRELKGMERCEITLMGTRRTEEQIEKRHRRSEGLNIGCGESLVE